MPGATERSARRGYGSMADGRHHHGRARARRGQGRVRAAVQDHQAWAGWLAGHGMALPAPAAARIYAYLAGRDDVTALPTIPGSAAAAARRRVLFSTGTGARMYRAEVRALLRRRGRAADLPATLAASLSPHSMRRFLAGLR